MRDRKKKRELEKEKYREGERNRERNRELEKERERNRERETEGQRGRDRNKVEIDTYLFVKWNKQIKLGRFRQNMVYTKLWCEKHYIVHILLHKSEVTYRDTVYLKIFPILWQISLQFK